MKHKKDAIEWGVVAGEREPASSATDGPAAGAGASAGGSGVVMKDKTGLGLGGWGRTPKDGRGPKTLKSVWREWSEAQEFRTRFEVLSAEEVERREIEKERASRCVVLLCETCLRCFGLLNLVSTDDCAGRHRNSRQHGQDDGECRSDAAMSLSALVPSSVYCIHPNYLISVFVGTSCWRAMTRGSDFRPLI